MELHKSQEGKTLLTLTTLGEIKLASIVANNDNWVAYPNILHPVKRQIHGNLARRAFEAAHQLDGEVQIFSLTDKETVIVSEGLFKLENELLHLDEAMSYSTNTLSRDATALSLARALNAFNIKE